MKGWLCAGLLFLQSFDVGSRYSIQGKAGQCVQLHQCSQGERLPKFSPETVVRERKLGRNSYLF